MMRKTILSIVAVMAISITLSAETKVSVYSVPFGLVGDVSKSNFRAFDKRLENVPSSSFSLMEDDIVMSGDGITIILDNKADKLENFNRMLVALYAYSKNTPGIDSNAVKQAISVLATKKGLE
jgi:hypothetical protein